MILVTILKRLLIDHAFACYAQVMLKELLPIPGQHALKNVNECKLLGLRFLDTALISLGLLLAAAWRFLLLTGELEDFLLGSVLLGVEVEGELELETIAVGVDAAD